jgi:hypothetical protein
MRSAVVVSYPKKKQPGKKFTGALAKILSAGQKETGMTAFFERRQIIKIQKTFINWVLCRFLPGGFPRWHRRC